MSLIWTWTYLEENMKTIELYIMNLNSNDREIFDCCQTSKLLPSVLLSNQSYQYL